MVIPALSRDWQRTLSGATISTIATQERTNDLDEILFTCPRKPLGEAGYSSSTLGIPAHNSKLPVFKNPRPSPHDDMLRRIRQMPLLGFHETASVQDS